MKEATKVLALTKDLSSTRVIRLKKGYVLILSLFLILTLSYVSAADNGTDIIKQDNNDLISVDEQDNNSISLSSEAAVINESSNAIGELLGSSQDGEILTVPSSDVLSTCVNVTPLSSSYYKEPTKKEKESTSAPGGDSDFLKAIHGKDVEKVLNVIDEVMQAIQVLQPNLYNAALDRLKDL